MSYNPPFTLAWTRTIQTNSDPNLNVDTYNWTLTDNNGVVLGTWTSNYAAATPAPTIIGDAGLYAIQNIRSSSSDTDLAASGSFTLNTNDLAVGSRED